MIRRYVLLAVVLLLALAGLVVVLNRSGETAIPADAAPRAGTAEQVARGERLARIGNCATCHTVRGGAAYAGGRGIATPFGTVYAGNLTPDDATGLGRWSADHFWRALHHGRSADGRLLYPAFPYPDYTRVTREDSDAIYAFLRSLPPVVQPNRPHALQFPYDTQAALAVWRALFFRPAAFQPEPQRPAEWNRGAYLVRGLGHCGACHSARDALGGTRQLTDLSGGLIPLQNWYAPSLASPTEAGMAEWPLQDIEQLLATGVNARASVLGPMAEVVLHSTQYLEPGDIRAMAVFLKSLPPAATDTDPREVPKATTVVLDRGAKLYGQHCVSCHGERGEGAPGAYPALAGNRAVTLPVTANLVQVVLYGGFPPATRGNPRPYGMPPFATTLSDADVAAVLTYVRGSWGNKAAPVDALGVAQQRGRQ